MATRERDLHYQRPPNRILLGRNQWRELPSSKWKRFRQLDMQAKLSRDSHLDKVPGFVGFHLLGGPEPGGSHLLCFSHRLGKPFHLWKRGPSQRRFGLRITGQRTTSRCIWITHSTSDLKFGRRTARPRNGMSASCCYEHHGATDTLDRNKSLSSWLGVRKSGGSPHGSNNAGSHR
jgi:hypothetical protein